MPDELQETTGAEQATPAQEPVTPAAAAPAEAEKFTYMTKEGAMTLTKAEQDQAVYLGIEAAKAQAAAAAAPKEESKPAAAPEGAVEDPRIAALEARVDASDVAAENAQILTEINTHVNGAGLHPDLLATAQKLIITDVAVAKSNSKGAAVNVGAIAAPIIAAQKELQKKYMPTFDADKKIKDATATKTSTTSGVTAGTDAPKPLGRKSFRDGSLTKRVFDKWQARSQAANE